MPDTIDRTQVAEPVRAALDALDDCGRVSTACAASMVDLGGMGAEVRTALDCADLCAAARRLLARHGSLDDGAVTAVVDAAIVACSASAAACGAHAGHHAHCAAHARSATACADALTALHRG